LELSIILRKFASQLVIMKIRMSTGTSVTRYYSLSVHGRQVGHMEKSILMLLLMALLMLFSNDASAQGVTHIKGDVNEDGEVNAKDIVALVDIIMKINSESAEKTNYYWYSGQENPMEMTSVSSIKTDFESGGGWFESGTTSIVQSITGGIEGVAWYDAMPSAAHFVPSSDNSETSARKIGNVIINGIKYDVWYNDGVASASHTAQYKVRLFSKVLVIGNSVTRHSYAAVASVMWLSDDKGMAATTIDNDFCQFVEEGLKKEDESAQVTRGYGVNWESNLPTDHNTLMGYLDYYNDDYDLIIFACSENIDSTDGNEIYLSAKEFFKVILEKWPKANLLVTSTRLCKGQAPNSEYSYKDIALQKAATEMNLDFVDVRQRDNDAFVSDFNTGEWLPIYAKGDNGLFVIQAAVYWHTCDIGMLRIANSILSALDYPTVDNAIHIISVMSNQDIYAPKYWVRNGLVTVLCYDCIPQNVVVTDGRGNSVPYTIKDMTSESLYGTPSRIPKAAVLFTMTDSNVTLKID